jgi:hypothetical protein
MAFCSFTSRSGLAPTRQSAQIIIEAPWLVNGGHGASLAAVKLFISRGLPSPAVAHQRQVGQLLRQRGGGGGVVPVLDPARPFASLIFLDKNRRDTGKSQSIWTDSTMGAAGSQHHLHREAPHHLDVEQVLARGELWCGGGRRLSQRWSQQQALGCHHTHKKRWAGWPTTVNRIGVIIYLHQQSPHLPAEARLTRAVALLNIS